MPDKSALKAFENFQNIFLDEVNFSETQISFIQKIRRHYFSNQLRGRPDVSSQINCEGATNNMANLH